MFNGLDQPVGETGLVTQVGDTGNAETRTGDTIFSAPYVGTQVEESCILFGQGINSLSRRSALAVRAGLPHTTVHHS